MPNASRYIEPGYTYHLTHRCHDRRFLLRTIRERSDYVSLNMVRAGVVGHPSEWCWCGDDELTGRRSRYRLLAQERMLASLDLPSMAAFQRLYSEGINEEIARRQLAREAVWTESLAIGDQAFVERAATSIGHRQRFTYCDAGPSAPGAVCVREACSSYSPEKA